MGQPDYDFFVRPGERGAAAAPGGAPDPRFGAAEPDHRFGAPAVPSQFGAPAPEFGVPAAEFGAPAPAPDRFGSAAPTFGSPTAPPDQFGAPAPTFGAPAPTHASPQRSLAPAGRRRGRRIGGFVGSGLLVIVAVKLALLGYSASSARAGGDWRHTTFVLPATIQGHPQVSSRNAAAMVQQIQAGVDKQQPGFFAVQGSAYGDGEQLLVLTMRPKRAITTLQQKVMLAGAMNGVKDSGITFRDVDSGPLGGGMRCGGNATAELCFTVDPAGMVLMVLPTGSSPSYAAAVRGEVELRNG